MDNKECIKILKQHNAWRRGGDGKMTEPKLIGEAMDYAVKALEDDKYKSIIDRLIYYFKGGRSLSNNHPIVEDAREVIVNTDKYITCHLRHCDNKVQNEGDYCESHLKNSGYYG